MSELDLFDAAEILGYSPSHLRQRIVKRRGLLEPCRRGGRGGKLFFRREDVERLKATGIPVPANGRKPKASWPPCAICGDPDGGLSGGARTPVRVDVTRFGIEGRACNTCYARIAARRRRGVDGGGLRRRAACPRCGFDLTGKVSA